MQLNKVKIEFVVHNLSREFYVYHNLDTISEYLVDWLIKSKGAYTDISFCRYVQSLNPSFVCMPEEQWLRLNIK